MNRFFSPQKKYVCDPVALEALQELAIEMENADSWGDIVDDPLDFADMINKFLAEIQEVPR